mmetsp:Transcript_70366/g.197353  ORF Transcript_70366/g.197353 Transcript_70366/m.197353 type:complete len:203 (-) Transcript_70366:285-893(-)
MKTISPLTFMPSRATAASTSFGSVKSANPMPVHTRSLFMITRQSDNDLRPLKSLRTSDSCAVGGNFLMATHMQPSGRGRSRGASKCISTTLPFSSRPFFSMALSTSSGFLKSTNAMPLGVPVSRSTTILTDCIAQPSRNFRTLASVALPMFFKHNDLQPLGFSIGNSFSFTGAGAFGAEAATLFSISFFLGSATLTNIFLPP